MPKLVMLVVLFMCYYLQLQCRLVYTKNIYLEYICISFWPISKQCSFFLNAFQFLQGLRQNTIKSY